MRATVLLSPGSGSPPVHHRFPPPRRRLLQPAPHEAHRAAAERSDRQYLAITKYEFTFNNCGKHRRTRRVATGGESDEIRSRPRARVRDKFRFTPPSVLSLRTIYIIITDGCCCTLPNTPRDWRKPSRFPFNPFLSHSDKSDFLVLYFIIETKTPY